MPLHPRTNTGIIAGEHPFQTRNLDLTFCLTSRLSVVPLLLQNLKLNVRISNWRYGFNSPSASSCAPSPSGFEMSGFASTHLLKWKALSVQLRFGCLLCLFSFSVWRSRFDQSSAPSCASSHSRLENYASGLSDHSPTPLLFYIRVDCLILRTVSPFGFLLCFFLLLDLSGLDSAASWSWMCNVVSMVACAYVVWARFLKRAAYQHVCARVWTRKKIRTFLRQIISALKKESTSVQAIGTWVHTA